MKTRATLLLALVLSLALVPVLASVPAHATGQYDERLDVYTVGQAGFWSITLDRLGSTSSLVSSVDSTTGLTSYRLVAMSGQGGTSDLQVFGVNGYNLLKIPSQPTQGLFLTVNFTSSAAASSVVSDLDAQFGTMFTQVSTTSSSSTYFAPVDFVNVATPVLYKLLPSSQGGFVSFVPKSTFVTLSMPFMVLSGVYNGSGFSHTISLGAVAPSIISSTSTVNLSELIGSTNATLSTSPSSGSSVVFVHSLDGVIVSSDASAKVADHISNFSGSYSISLGSGKTVNINATVQSQPPTAVAYRLLDHGAIGVNQTLGVTVVVTNTAKTGTLDNVTLNDDWFQSMPTVFQKVSGNSSFVIPTLSAGQNVTETYVLKVLSSAAQQVTIPTATVSFGYSLSSSPFTGHATLGQQYVQLNQVEPSLNVAVRASISSGSPLGTAGDYLVTLTNTGSSPALNVRIENYTVSSIAEDGGSTSIDIPIALHGLANRNLSKTFSVEYANTQGTSQNITTNSVQLMLSHTSMVVPYIQLTNNDTVTATTLAAKTLLLTYSFTNGGKGNPSIVTSTQALPQGVGCTVQSGIGNCTGGAYTMTTTSLTTQKNNLNLTFGTDNYYLAPTSITANYEGMQLHFWGPSNVIPAGVTATKTFSPEGGFPGITSTVTVAVENVGSAPVYNATVSSGLDSFDSSANSTASTTKTYPQIASNASESFTYPVLFSTVSTGGYGNLTGSPVETGFIFAGSLQSLALSGGHATLYQPVTATVHSTPSSPEENHDFQLVITITNHAAVDVTNVVYTLTIPSGVKVVSGATLSNHQVTVNIPSLPANSNKNVSLTVSTTTGLTIDTNAAHLTFQYVGTTLDGVISASKVVVSVDSTTRYTIPIAVAIVAALVAVVYVRRRVETTAKS